ncbi:hypothetical protein AAIM60_06285 [Pseudomonas lijiangensis]
MKALILAKKPCIRFIEESRLTPMIDIDDDALAKNFAACLRKKALRPIPM